MLLFIALTPSRYGHSGQVLNNQASVLRRKKYRYCIRLPVNRHRNGVNELLGAKLLQVLRMSNWVHGV